jgi:epoxyqueuosine reductase
LSKLLLHTCCGPCTTYVYKWLVENNFEVKGYFYNPNIYPQDEYERRLITMEHYATAVGLKVIYQPNDLETKAGDCENCYRVRFEKCAKFAKENGFDVYSTTLSISPYQKQELIKEVGEDVAKKFGIDFFYHDFREGYRESRETSRKMKLYMQKYCGCGIEKNLRKEADYAQAG